MFAASRNPDQLVGLQGQAPDGILQANPHRFPDVFRVADRIGIVHGLQEEIVEGEAGEFGEVEFLRPNQFQFLSGLLDPARSRFGAHADPVHSTGDLAGAVGFQGDVEASGVQGVDQGGVQLQGGFAAGDDHAGGSRCAAPEVGHGVGEGVGRFVFASVVAVGGYEIRVAEAAGGGLSGFFLAVPQVATGKAQEDRRPAGAGAFSLQGREDLLDPVGHGVRSPYRARTGSSWPAWWNPARRRRHESHSRHGAPSGRGS